MSPKKRQTLKSREEINQIVSKHIEIVRFTALKYKNSLLSLEDKIAEGMLGMIRAAELYDESKGYMFSSYAKKWIKGYIQNAVNKEKKHLSHSSILLNNDENIYETYNIENAQFIDPLRELILYEDILQRKDADIEQDKKVRRILYAVDDKKNIKSEMNKAINQRKKPKGKLPYGYAANEKNLLIHNEYEQNIIRAVKQLQELKLSYYKITQKLNDFGFRSRNGKPFHLEQVRRIAMK